MALLPVLSGWLGGALSVFAGLAALLGLFPRGEDESS